MFDRTDTRATIRYFLGLELARHNTWLQIETEAGLLSDVDSRDT